MIISIEGPVYLDQTKPNVNRILANLIYFWLHRFSKNILTSRQMNTLRMRQLMRSWCVTGDLAIWRYQPNQIIPKYGFLGFDFLSSELETQTEK
jgi:hypothetical protein